MFGFKKPEAGLNADWWLGIDDSVSPCFLSFLLALLILFNNVFVFCQVLFDFKINCASLVQTSHYIYKITSGPIRDSNVTGPFFNIFEHGQPISIYINVRRMDRYRTVQFVTVRGMDSTGVYDLSWPQQNSCKVPISLIRQGSTISILKFLWIQVILIFQLNEIIIVYSDPWTFSFHLI